MAEPDAPETVDPTAADSQLDRADSFSRMGESDPEVPTPDLPPMDPEMAKAVMAGFEQVGKHLTDAIAAIRALKTSSEQLLKTYDNAAITMAVDTFLPESVAIMDFLVQTQNDVQAASAKIAESQGGNAGVEQGGGEQPEAQPEPAQPA